VISELRTFVVWIVRRRSANDRTDASSPAAA